MGSLSPETAQMLTAWADAAEGFDKAATGANAGQGPSESPSSSSANHNGALDLGSSTIIATVKPGERFLQKTLQLQDYLQTLPVAEAQVVMLGMQALMGPAKAAIGLAGSVLLNAAFGDQIDAFKEGAAVGITAGITDSDKATVQADHEKAKQEYAAGNEDYLNGDGYVLASRFLIDVVAGEIGSLGGKVAGRAIGVVSGPKGTNTPPAPRNASNLAGGPLENAAQISGRFKLDGGPVNGTLYRADNQGNITSYAVYDSAGMIVKRVDVTGTAHANVSTPHVIEYGRNQLPDGTTRVQSPSSKLAPRPAKSDEIP
ncbi:polymorphic toxin type 24 domain-containing protein [Stutzerimonas sp. VN223-3]|uniref:polymorphic toxin type 24 domain-containing protein n=1 Tax=Stutzerimonas sp. VN223-3 TaxID=3384601 RepID=UPI0038B5108E